MTEWELLRWLHVLAMAFFVGGQLVLVAAVVPAFRGVEDRSRLQAIARRFGIGSLVALAVNRLSRWDAGQLQVKLTLVAITGLLILIHMRRPNQHWLEGLVFILSLAIVWLGVALSH